MSSRTPEVDVDQLSADVNQGAVVVDVRERGEYAQVHVPGALFIPMSQLTARMVNAPWCKQADSELSSFHCG